eukprot:4539104-Ditylum_brightwellii.AAC.1
MIYYMGLVQLPSLCDYWSTDHYMPQHRVMKELGMTMDHFLFMWHNFHVYNEKHMATQAQEEVEKEYDSDDDGILEFVLKHGQKGQEVEDPSDKEGEEEEEACGKRKEGSPSEKKI